VQTNAPAFVATYVGFSVSQYCQKHDRHQQGARQGEFHLHGPANKCVFKSVVIVLFGLPFTASQYCFGKVFPV